MGESQQAIALWAEETFGLAPSPARIAARANEEMAELLRAATGPAPSPERLLGEIADIVIVLFRLAHVLDGDLLAEVDRKMAVNRARTWKLDGSGHGYHVREKGRD